LKPAPLVMDHRFFLHSLVVAGLALLGCLFFAFIYIGLWYWRVKHDG